ncbi:MAG: hypothetical protein HRT69_12000, partial [Flavobacteriaceae bacterium]|nr:hypothetical protein [Flavobacteriaceae bacterium]
MNIKILYLSIVSLFLTNFCWSQVPASEKAALQVFYNDTNGDNWNNTIVNNSVWEFNTPVSNWASIYPSIGWYGVRVDQGITEDHVGILRISNNNLNGILSPELSQLTNLVELTVHGNLSGSIPAEFVQLENLQKLSLGGGFSGEIPIWINQLQNLKELNLGKGLTGNIPVELTQLPVLETLGLTGNNFLDTNIPSFMGNITTLKSLALINNHDGGIPDEFTLLSNLNNLILSGNNLSGTIPDLTNLPLVYLDIRNNKFRFIDFETDFSEYKTNIGDYFIYSPQQNIDDEEILSLPIGTSHDLVMFNAGTYSNNNSYQWYKGVYPNGIKITGATNRIYSLSNISVATAGSYYCLAKNPNISGLTLIRNQISITVGGNSCPIVPNGSVYAEAGKICFGDNKQYNFSGNLTNATYTWNFYDADAETILHSTNEISPNYIYVNNNIAHFQDYIIELIITTEDNCSYGYTHVVTIQDCTPPCAENNPKSEEVKVLFLDLLNHLKGKQINNEVVPEGYNPQELIALSPYITDVNPKIFNFNTIGSTFSFSFSLAHDVDVSIGGWGNNTDYSAGNMDLSNYISSNYSTKTYYYYETSGSQISGRNHYVRHVNFCPETVVQQPCTVTNENSQVVKTLYINLLNHLKNEVLTGNTIPSGYNPLEMQALAPYVTEFSEAKIYSFVSSGGSLSFSFAKSSLKAAPHGVDVEISNWNDNFDFALGDINLSNYLSNTGYTNSSLFYNNTGEEITNHRVRHINFCPDEILTPCNDVVNGNISIVSKGGPGGICIDQSISFVFNSTMQNITNYSWTFVNSNPLYEPSGPTTTNATYTYTAPGSYVIKVEITLDNECTYVIENTIVVNDCSSIPCTENNPKTEVVKGLYISLLNHLKKQHIDGVTISNGYNPVEMQNLAPYVEDVNAKVYNFYANDDYIRFSFVGGSKTHYIDVEVNDWSNNIAYELGGVDLVNYTSSNVYTESAVSYAANGVSIPGHKVRHINFCPDEIVAPCDDVVAGNIVVNSKAQIVEYCINDTYAFKFNTTTLQNITNYSWTFYDTD